MRISIGLWLNKGVHLIESFSTPASRLVNSVGAIVLAAMMFLVAADVVLRYFLDKPIVGSSELVELMLVCVTFLAVGYTASEKGHISITLLISRFPQRAQAIIGIFTSLFSLVLVVLIAWWSVDRGNYMWESGHVSMVWFIPLHPFLYLVAFGCTLFAIVLLANFLDYLAKAVSK